MLSRALSLATVTMLIGWLVAAPVRAQTQNLEAGKSPSQIFAGTCTACHKSPQGLLKTVSPGSLPGFLRQHYTTSGDMASMLSSYLVSNGATDTRYGSKPSTEPKSEARSGSGSEQPDRQGRRVRPGAQEAAKPDAEGTSQQGEPGRQGHRRLARPAEGPDETKPAVVDGQAPVQADDARKLTAKQRPSKQGRSGGEEVPKADTAKSDAAKFDAAKPDTAKSDASKDESPKAEAKSEPAKEDSGKPEEPKPAAERKSEAAKVEGPNDNGSGTPPVLPADPVPAVTPAPPAPAASPAAASGAPEHAAGPRPSASVAPGPPAVTASAPPPAPAAASGPPVPPISQ